MQSTSELKLLPSLEIFIHSYVFFCAEMEERNVTIINNLVLCWNVWHINNDILSGERNHNNSKLGAQRTSWVVQSEFRLIYIWSYKWSDGRYFYVSTYAYLIIQIGWNQIQSTDSFVLRILLASNSTQQRALCPQTLFMLSHFSLIDLLCTFENSCVTF